MGIAGDIGLVSFFSAHLMSGSGQFILFLFHLQLASSFIMEQFLRHRLRQLAPFVLPAEIYSCCFTFCGSYIYALQSKCRIHICREVLFEGSWVIGNGLEFFMISRDSFIQLLASINCCEHWGALTHLFNHVVFHPVASVLILSFSNCFPPQVVVIVCVDFGYWYTKWETQYFWHISMSIRRHGYLRWWSDACCYQSQEWIICWLRGQDCFFLHCQGIESSDRGTVRSIELGGKEEFPARVSGI